MKQEQKARSTTERKTTDRAGEDAVPGAEARDRAAQVSADTDELLDDIDELLNELPEDLATEYRQQGGE